MAGRLGNADYERNVFVNCPFDEQFRPLFRALVFTVLYCGFRVRCALEVDDSGETRAEKIVRLIRGSRYGIHDISRTESNAAGLPRFNMPYELGLFIGFKHGGGRKQNLKAALVLDRQPYRYQQFLSDIAGQDIHSHGNKPAGIIREVRNWLFSQAARELPGPDYIAERFVTFTDSVPQLLGELNKSAEDLNNYLDYYQLAFGWVASNASR